LTRRIWIKRKVQFDDIRAVLRELVRSSVATEHNVLRHRNLPIGINGRVSNSRQNQFERRYSAFTNRSTAERGKPHSARHNTSRGTSARKRFRKVDSVHGGSAAFVIRFAVPG
jgi:hypothetical protein